MAKEASSLFAQYKSIRDYLAGVIADSAEIHRDRNILVHGKVWVKIEIGNVVDGRISGTIAITCAGIHRSKQVVREFRLAALEDLYYEEAHLHGRLGALIDGSDALPIAPSERLFLQAFLEKNYQKSTIPPTQ